MSWNKLKGVIGKAAPIVGTLLGGPAGASVGTLVASALDIDPTPEELGKFLTTDPDAQIKLAEIERNYAVQLRQIAIEEAKLEIEHQKAIYRDRQNARLRLRRSFMPPVITVMVTSAFFAVCYLLLVGEHVATDNSDILYLLLGALVVVFKDACAFYLGGEGGNTREERFELKAHKEDTNGKK